MGRWAVGGEWGLAPSRPRALAPSRPRALAPSLTVLMSSELWVMVHTINNITIHPRCCEASEHRGDRAQAG